jgi:hypothetical protein
MLMMGLILMGSYLIANYSGTESGYGDLAAIGWLRKLDRATEIIELGPERIESQDRKVISHSYRGKNENGELVSGRIYLRRLIVGRWCCERIESQ